MKSFVFEGKVKTTLSVFMLVGFICLVLSWFAEPAALITHDAEGNELVNNHMRFWSNFLQNSAFFTLIAFVALFTLSAWTTAYAGWYVQFKRIYEAFSAFLIPGFFLMLLIAAGIWGHFHHLYHWADESLIGEFLTDGTKNPHFDKIIDGKSPFLNKNWFTFGTIIIVGIWIFCWYKLRTLSVAEDTADKDNEFKIHKKIRFWAGTFLPFAAFSICAIVWLWMMSVDAHWYSTLYAWYNVASVFVAMTAMTIALLIWLKGKGYYPNITQEHLHDLGKFMFAFSVFWTYLWFSQYMLIWYGNNGEETIYFKDRVNNYPILWYGNLVLNFILPFLILMRNSNKRKYGTLILMCIVCFFGHWWDFFYMVKPGTYTTAADMMHHGVEHSADAVHSHGGIPFTMGFTIPGFLEIGIMLGFLAFFLFVTFSTLAKAALVPGQDPYLEESFHHEVLQSEGEHH